jgi:hypothetical protein
LNSSNKVIRSIIDLCPDIPAEQISQSTQQLR